jgi:hypothetical protein
MDTGPDLRVVVFESANPEFYLAHFDMTGQSAEATKTVGPSGLPVAMDVLVRLTTSPVATIAQISLKRILAIRCTPWFRTAE